jgi:cytochrome c-type biogenesis protein CcmH
MRRTRNGTGGSAFKEMAKRGRRRVFAVLALVCLAVVQAPALAVQPDEVLKDPQLEARARALGRDLRCLVCQNQSIDDSDAALAKDLRLLVREQLKAGKSDQDIKDYLVARYGNFILLKPPFEWDTAALWLSPFVVFGLGGVMIWRARRKTDTTEAQAATPLSMEESERLKAMLGDQG